MCYNILVFDVFEMFDAFDDIVFDVFGVFYVFDASSVCLMIVWSFEILKTSDMIVSNLRSLRNKL